MASINSRDIVDAIIARNGNYEGDPTVVRIVQYNNMFNGAITYGLIYKGEDLLRYHNAEACLNVETIWERK